METYILQKKLKSREVQRSDVLFQEETQRKNSAKCISVNMRVVKACECVRLFFRPPKVSSNQHKRALFPESARVMANMCVRRVHMRALHICTLLLPRCTKRLATYGSAVLILMKARNKTLEKHSLPRSFHLPAPMGVQARERALFGWRGGTVEFQPFAQ
jgi:hypothetical protein